MGDLVTQLEKLQLDVNGFSFSALAAGPPDGPLVLLLHGWPQFADSWAPIAAELASDGYRAVAVDQRGYSSGARPEAISSYAIDELSRDVLGFADALGRPRFHLVAHDWGAIVGWFVAANHGDRLASFASFATPHPRALWDARVNDPDQQKRTAYVDVFRAPGFIAEKALMGNGAAALRAVYEGKVPPEQVDENVRRLKEPGALTALLNWYRAVDFDRHLGPVAVPTFYGWGSNDRALGESAARATAGYVTGPYHFEIFSGVSHWVFDEVPRESAAMLREHLGAHAL